MPHADGSSSGNVESATDRRDRFLKATQNHAEFRRKLAELGLTTSSDEILEYARHVGECWFGLATEHLQDAKDAAQRGMSRSVYSRSYYAVYNASKAVRYLAQGWVSLKTEDHQKAVDLPGDFPDVDNWSIAVRELYEHRLRADYDNWATTAGKNTLKPDDCIARAETFVVEAARYLNRKYGTKL